LLDSFGTWNKTVYGLPFDNYAGVMFYNKCMLKDAGFSGPAKTYQEIIDTYGPKISKDGKYAYALQSAMHYNQLEVKLNQLTHLCVWSGLAEVHC